MDATSAAKILFFSVIKGEGDRLRPGEFDLPDSVGASFTVVASFYLEASMLLALQGASKEKTELVGTLREFEQLILSGLDEPNQAKYRTHVVEAVNDLRLLFNEKNSEWRESGFATKFWALVGIIRFVTTAQPGPSSSVRLTEYWTNMPLIMHKTIQRLAGGDSNGID